MRRVRAAGRLAGLFVIAAMLVACAADAPGASLPAASTGPSATAATASALLERLGAIEAVVARWRAAPDLRTAKAAAEEARNLVVGPDGPGYGDADGDGTIAGAVTDGLLPGVHGAPGIARASSGPCVVRDVLGGDWSDPAARWATLDQAISAWSPANNTFPALPSHPQRLVGWATLALQTEDLATALEFGGHAQLHADISMRATTACDA